MLYRLKFKLAYPGMSLQKLETASWRHLLKVRRVHLWWSFLCAVGSHAWYVPSGYHLGLDGEVVRTLLPRRCSRPHCRHNFQRRGDL